MFFKFFDSNAFVGCATLITAIVALFLYLAAEQRNRSNAAKIVIQEIRRAEKMIEDIKQTEVSVLGTKIIVTNSWGKNMHYFVDEFEIDELDKVSNLYAVGEYLDLILNKVFQDKAFASAENFQKIDSLPWRQQVQAIVAKYQPVYNSNIGTKFKKIADQQ